MTNEQILNKCIQEFAQTLVNILRDDNLPGVSFEERVKDILDQPVEVPLIRACLKEAKNASN